MEVACLGRRWLTGLAVFVVVFESLTGLVLRAHYTMDVFTGMVTGLYAAHLANHISTSPKTTTSELPAGNVTILRVPPFEARRHPGCQVQVPTSYLGFGPFTR